jgi:hypothetical protein
LLQALELRPLLSKHSVGHVSKFGVPQGKHRTRENGRACSP